MGKKPWEQFKSENHVDVDTVVAEEKKPWEKFAQEPVKKKDLTVSAPSSESGTTPLSSQKSSSASEQQQQPLEKSGENITQSSDTEQGGSGLSEKIIGNVFKGLYDLGRKAISVFTSEAPASIATEKAIEQRTDFINELIRKEPHKYGVANEFASDETRRKFAEKIADKEFPGWREGKEVMTKEGKVIKTGPLFTESAIRKKQELLAEAAKQKKEEKFISDIPKTWEEAKAKGNEGVTSYIGSAIGNGLGQIPLSVLSMGTSSYVMEKAGAYDEAVSAIAKENGITEEQVIQSNLDQPAKDVAHYVGLINGGIDLASSLFTVGKAASPLKNVMKKQANEEFLKDIPKEILKKGAKLAAAPLTEYGTEFAQETITQASAQIAAGKKPEDITIDWNRSREAGLQGLFGAMGVVGAGNVLSPKQTIEQAKSNIKSTDDQATIEKEAAKIIESVTNPTPQEGVQNGDINELGSKETQAGLGTEVQAWSEQNRTERGTVEGESVSNNGGSGTQEVRSAEDVSNGSEGQEILNPEEDASKIEGSVALGEQPIGTQSSRGVGSEGMESSQQGQETTGTRTEEQRQPGELSKEEEIGEPSEVPVDEKGTQPIFFYGTLKDKKTLEEALGTKVATEDSSALGEKTTEKGYPIFTPGGTKEVKGVVARLTPEQINTDLKDKWGEGKNYDLKSITLADGTKALAFINKKTVNENPQKTTQGSEVLNTESKEAQPPPIDSGEAITSEKPEGRQYAVARRIEQSNANQAIKVGIKEKGDTYIPKGLNVTESEAKDLIDFYGPEKSETLIRDTGNKITGDTRVVMAGQLYDQYSQAAEKFTDPKQKQALYDKAIDMAFWAEDYLMQSGRTANSGKFWKKIVGGGENQIVLAIDKQKRQEAEGLISPIRDQLGKTQEQIDAEIKRLVEKGIQEQVGQRLEKAKLITKEKRKEIADFFDGLKVNAPKNMATAALLPIGVLPHVWNASIDIVKQAVLTGADVANAIQAGIDYIKQQQKAPFDEEEFKKAIQPGVEKLFRTQIKASDVKEESIDTPKLKGKKKAEFIESVVESYNKGELTNEKFEQLYAKKLGFREFTDSEKSKIRELAKIISTAEKFESQLKDNFTRENLEKNKELMKAAQQANQLLQEFATAPGKLSDTLIAIMQGNVMSSLSLVSNIFYNIAFQPLRFTSTGFGQLFDYSMSQLAKIGLLSDIYKDRTIDLAAAQKGYFQGGWNGTLEGLEQMKTGALANERNLREIQSSFNPGRAISRWSNKDRQLSQKVNDAIEGTLGWSAEGMFRALNLGDKPWRRGAELARAYELGSLKGLKGEQLEKFVFAPDEATKEEMAKAGQESTFQQSGEYGKKLQSGIAHFLNLIEEKGGPYLGGAAKVLLKSQVLFIKTPWNLMSETLDYAAPPVTLARAIYEGKKGNKRQAAILGGKAVVGSMIMSAATYLFIRGLLTGDDDKDRKKREFQAEGGTPPPNSINTSALSRGLVGKGWDIKDGDTWVSYQRMGVLGVLFDNYANIYKDRVAETGQLPTMNPAQMLGSDVFSTLPRVASSGLDQTFLSGTSTLLDAIKDGGDKKTQQWLLNTTQTLGSIALPNVIGNISKATDEYNRDIQDKSFGQKLLNTYKTKLFIGDQLPAKVNLWGEKIKGSPEGREKAFYYLFDPTKFRELGTDSMQYKLYEQFKTDYSGDWLPQVPERVLDVKGKKVELSSEDYAKLCEYVGQARYDMASSYIKTWDSDTADERKKELQSIYREGYQIGKEKFGIDTGLKVRLPYEVKRLKSRFKIKIKP